MQLLRYPLDDAYAVVIIHDLGDGIERVALSERSLCDGGDILLKYLKMLGDIHLAVEFLDLLNEKSRFLSVVNAVCLKAGDVGELRKGSRSGRAVILEDIGEYDCVCETVRSAVHSAEVVGYRVDIADISSGEGDTRKVGATSIFSLALRSLPFS